MYYSEQVHTELIAEPRFPSDFESIPGTFWWCAVTLLTVGYGDQVPITGLGKLMAGLAMVVAVVVMALPISVIGTQFTQHWVNFKKQSKREARTAVAYTDFQDLVASATDQIMVCPPPACRCSQAGQHSLQCSKRPAEIAHIPYTCKCSALHTNRRPGARVG